MLEEGRQLCHLLIRSTRHDAKAHASHLNRSALPRERVRCVPSMFNRLGVKVP